MLTAEAHALYLGFTANLFTLAMSAFTTETASSSGRRVRPPDRATSVSDIDSHDSAQVYFGDSRQHSPYFTYPAFVIAPVLGLVTMISLIVSISFNACVATKSLARKSVARKCLACAHPELSRSTGNFVPNPQVVVYAEAERAPQWIDLTTLSSSDGTLFGIWAGCSVFFASSASLFLSEDYARHVCGTIAVKGDIQMSIASSAVIWMTGNAGKGDKGLVVI